MDKIKNFFKIYSFIVFAIFVAVGGFLFFMLYNKTNGFTEDPGFADGLGFGLLGYIIISIITFIFYKIEKSILFKVPENESSSFYKEKSREYFFRYLLLTIVIYLFFGPFKIHVLYDKYWNFEPFYFSYILFLLPVVFIGIFIRYMYVDDLIQKRYLKIIFLLQFLVVIINPFLLEILPENIEKTLKNLLIVLSVFTLVLLNKFRKKDINLVK